MSDELDLDQELREDLDLDDDDSEQVIGGAVDDDEDPLLP